MRHRPHTPPRARAGAERTILTIGLACDSREQRQTVIDNLASMGLTPIGNHALADTPPVYEYTPPSNQLICGCRMVTIVITDAEDRRRSMWPNVLLLCFSTADRAAAARLEARWGTASRSSPVARRKGTPRVLVGTTTKPDAPKPTAPAIPFADALDLAVKVDALKYIECTFASGVTAGARLLFDEAIRLAVEEKAKATGGCAIL